MFTELFCNSAGGPEVVTSKGFDEAKLGVHPNQWPAFLALVAEAAAVWPTKHHRDLVLRICEASKVEICAGLEGEDALAVERPVPASDALPRCPFSGSSGSAGQCPFTSASPGVGAASREQRGVSSVISGAGSQMPMAGRVLGSSLQQRLDQLTDEDPDLCCPVSLVVFSQPVIASDGFIYDESSLMTLLRNRQVSPMTREVLKQEYRPAQQKKLEVETFLQTQSQALLQFAQEAAPQQPEMSVKALDRASEYLEKLRAGQAKALASKAAQLYGQLGRPVPAGLQQIVR